MGLLRSKNLFISSKIQYLWEFTLENKQRRVELIHSRLSGKRRIYFDGCEVTTVQKYTYEFSYSFSKDNHYYSLQQVNPTMYDLRIDNLGFNYIVNELKKGNVKEDKKVKDSFEKGSNNKNDKIAKEVDDDFFRVKSNPVDFVNNNFNDKDFDFEDNTNKNVSQNKTSFEDIFG